MAPYGSAVLPLFFSLWYNERNTLRKEKDMLDRARAIADHIVGWRRYVHQHPELSFQEHETARFVAQTLREMGIGVQTRVGKTGVVGRLGSGSPVIALRADMDALPIQENTGLPFASQTPGIMHACGHDVHVACLLGAAKLLSETPLAQGEIRFLFQPSEESPDQDGVTGAARMMQDGALDEVDAIVGLHVWAEVPAGSVALSPGPQWAAAGKFQARIRGHGGHGAMPHQAVDPIVLTAQAIVALQTVVSRRLDPLDAGVVTVGSIHGGTRDNIIPEYVDITGTLRSLDTEIYEKLKSEVTRALSIVRTLGGDVQIEYSSNIPVTNNDTTLTAFVTEVAIDLVGADAVLPAKPVMGGEDFGLFAAEVPGCYLRLGGGFPGQPLRNHHDPHFDIDESALPIGAAILAATAKQYLVDREEM
jgi:amidohydrolase